MKQNIFAATTLQKSLPSPQFCGDDKIVLHVTNSVIFTWAFGRRGTLSLENILEYSTATDEEPLLGFEIQPSLTFVECAESFLPVANTCISRMTLPRPSSLTQPTEDATLFETYDLAFSNTYCGLM